MSKELPESGETVVCRIAKILNYGVFVDLLEYEGVQGFVHVSQVSSSWVKNIRNFVKENQIRAAKVTRIDTQKNQIDLSFNKVTPRAQRAKIEEYKQFKRAQKMIEVLAKEQRVSFDEAWGGIAVPLMEKHDSLYGGFQKILLEGEAAAEGVSPKFVKPLLELVEKNVERPQKTVRGTLTLTSLLPDGVNVIRNTLAEAEKKAGKAAELDIYYAGAGKYIFTVVSPDYKQGEKTLRDISSGIIESFKGKGTATFEKAE